MDASTLFGCLLGPAGAVYFLQRFYGSSLDFWFVLTVILELKFTVRASACCSELELQSSPTVSSAIYFHCNYLRWNFIMRESLDFEPWQSWTATETTTVWHELSPTAEVNWSQDFNLQMITAGGKGSGPCWQWISAALGNWDCFYSSPHSQKSQIVVLIVLTGLFVLHCFPTVFTS